MGNTTEPFALKKRDYCGTHHMYFEQKVGCGICNRIVQDAHEREKRTAFPAVETDIEDVVFENRPAPASFTTRIAWLRASLREIRDVAQQDLPPEVGHRIARYAQEALDADDCK